ncbi:MAG: hypothetical protein U0Q18_34205 [Bryobacteraceae bacterium]
MGFTDKVKGEVVFKEVFKDSREALMVSALHEMVHWVSDPAGQGKQVTAMGFLERGLLEGLTQVVTEDLLQDQGIAPYSKPIYAERASIVRKLIDRIGIRPFGEALFGGRVQRLQPLLDTYGYPALQKIRMFATMNNSQAAITCIENLNRAQDSKQKKAVGAR